MTLEIIPIGGFSEIGRNCVAIKVDEEVVICDIGLMLDKYIEYTEGLDNEKQNISGKKLIQVGAAPDINWVSKTPAADCSKTICASPNSSMCAGYCLRMSVG